MVGTFHNIIAAQMDRYELMKQTLDVAIVNHGILMEQNQLKSDHILYLSRDNDEVHARYKDALAELKRLSAECMECYGEAEMARNEQLRTMDQLVQCQAESDRLEEKCRELEKLDAKCKKLEKKTLKIENEMEDMSERHDTMEETVALFREKRDEMQITIDKQSKQIESLISKKASAEAENTKFAKESSKLFEKMYNLEKKLKKIMKSKSYKSASDDLSGSDSKFSLNSDEISDCAECDRGRLGRFYKKHVKEADVGDSDNEENTGSDADAEDTGSDGGSNGGGDVGGDDGDNDGGDVGGDVGGKVEDSVVAEVGGGGGGDNGDNGDNGGSGGEHGDTTEPEQDKDDEVDKMDIDINILHHEHHLYIPCHLTLCLHSFRGQYHQNT